PGAQHAAASAGLDEVELAMEGDGVFDAEAVVEVEQVDAALEQDVLAVIDGLGAGFVGGCAAAEEGSRFEDSDVMACAAQGRGGGESCQTSTRDDYIGHG